MYDTLSELIKNLTMSPYIKLKEWVYTSGHGRLSFLYNGELIASYENGILTLHRQGMEKFCMERELLMKRFSEATSSTNYVYNSPKGEEVFIGYADGDFMITLYGTGSRIIILPNGEYLKVYSVNADNILNNLYRYNVDKSSDAPNQNYACKIKMCLKCGMPFLTKHKVAHIRRQLCWICEPQRIGGLR